MQKGKGKKKSNNNAKKSEENTNTQDDDDEPPPVIGLIDKKEIRNLSRGAEDTSSDSCCDSDDTQIRRKRRTGLTTSMERSMRRLLRSTLKEKKKNKKKASEGKTGKTSKTAKEDSDDDIVDKDGKIRYDMRQYDLDTYVEILRSLHNIEFKPEEKKQTITDNNKFEIVRKEGEAAKILYNDKL